MPELAAPAEPETPVVQTSPTVPNDGGGVSEGGIIPSDIFTGGSDPSGEIVPETE
ncbi:MAG: hypothetical protein MJ157_04550 [Clostridia bacterium]|nr:hypothetical protein [Clostridia bacterium]